MPITEIRWHRLGSLSASASAVAYDAAYLVPVQDADGKLRYMTLGTLLASVSADNLPYSVKSRSLTTPPGTPSSGDTYIVAGTGGAWSGFTAGDIVRWNGSAWVLVVSPSSGMRVYNEGESADVQYQGGAWTTIGGGGGTASYWITPVVSGGVAGDTFADPDAPVPVDFGVVVRDEGSVIGSGIVEFDLVGAGITASVTGNKATINVGGGAAPPAYETFTIGALEIPAGTTGANITLVASTNMTIVGDAGDKTITFSATGGIDDAVKTIAVSGQTSIVATGETTLNVAATGGAAWTTTPGTNTLSLAAAAASHTHNPALVLTDPLVARMTAQGISAGTEATLDLDTEIYDPNTNYTLSTDGEVTCTAAGTYVSLALINCQGSANSTQSPGAIKIQDNSSGSFADVANTNVLYSAMAMSVYTNSAANPQTVGIHTLAAGNKIRVRATPTSGYSLTNFLTGSRLLVFRLATTGN
jgi:hypothetical protein